MPTVPTPVTSPTEARTIAKDAYIYGFPLVDNYRIQYLVLRRPQQPGVQDAVEQDLQQRARLHARRQSHPDAEL